MTIVTKPLSEKKEGDKNLEPLVADVKIVVPERPSGNGVRMVPLSNAPLAGHTPMRIKCVVRRRLPSCLGFCLLLTLLIISIPFFANLLYSAARTSVYHEWCAVPFGDEGLVGSDVDSAAFTDTNILQYREDAAVLLDSASAIMSENFKKLVSDARKVFSEEFEIEDNVEKINVPDFSGGRRSRYIHDFKTNTTGIIDLDGKRCFVMPLNRTAVLPPKGLVDLIKKMQGGYYDINPRLLRQNMRVILPAIENRAELGDYIMSDCYNYPIYRLEQVTSRVFKRSPDSSDVQFMSFAGKGTTVLNIINYSELSEHEVDGPIAMA